MYRMTCNSLSLGAALILCPFVLGARQDRSRCDGRGDAQTSLSIAREEYHVVILLGQLAAQDAESALANELKTPMVDEHKNVRREVEQLASRHSVPFPTKLAPENTHRVDELSQLPGHELDRADMAFALHNHDAAVEECRHYRNTLKYPDRREYCHSTLPLLEAHLQQARQVKKVLQIKP